MRYMLTEKSERAKAVKKLWSGHVIDILKSFDVELLCFSLKWITCAGLFSDFYKFQIRNSSD